MEYIYIYIYIDTYIHTKLRNKDLIKKKGNHH
jgi:hypothetical protein